jgi:hypothetical protein
MGRDGKIKFRMDCGKDDVNPVPLANGEGVLVEVENREQTQFRRLAPDKEPLDFAIGANAYLLACVPRGDLVLSRTREQELERFQIVHGSTGQVVWDIASPVRPIPNIATQAIVSGNRVLLVGRDVAAVDLESGKLAAVWEPADARSIAGRFFRQGNEVFILTESAFFKLNFSDMDLKQSGWH